MLQSADDTSELMSQESTETLLNDAENAFFI